MKKSVIYIVISAFLFLFTSCGMSPDDMIEEFNKNVYKDVGGGDYIIENGKPSVSTSLIELPVYRIMENGMSTIEVSDEFYNYKWVLIDNSVKKESERETVINNNSFSLTILASSYGLKKDGDYTISLFVTNRDGVLFTDSAKLVVIDNPYD